MTVPDRPVDERASEQRRVGIGEYAVASDDESLTAVGLGSCVGVALCDERAALAGLAHVMLPAADGTDERPAKFADTGVETLWTAMARAGAERERVVAKLAGGSDMLGTSGGDLSMGARNLAAVRGALSGLSIPVRGEAVGGRHGRSLTLEAATGDLIVERAGRTTRML